jgi:hypothetical protein
LIRKCIASVVLRWRDREIPVLEIFTVLPLPSAENVSIALKIDLALSSGNSLISFSYDTDDDDDGSVDDVVVVVVVIILAEAPIYI